MPRDEDGIKGGVGVTAFGNGSPAVGARWCSAKAAAVSVAAILAATSMLAPAASADHSFCPPGTGAGQCDGPNGVAVDDVSGNVYVVDHGNDRINVFKADGTALPSFGSKGSGPGQFEGPQSIAIDNDPASPAFRDVYVGTDNFRVQKFDREGNFLLSFGSQGIGSGQISSTSDPLAVGPSGAVYVGDSLSSGGGAFESRIEKFDPTTGALVGVCAVPAPKARLTALGVDLAGEIYAVFDEAGNGVRKYAWGEPSCTALANLDAGVQTRVGLAIGDEGRVFAVQQDSAFKFITEYSSAGAKIARFGFGKFDSVPRGLAVNGVTGDLYYSEEGNEVVHLPTPPPGPLVASLKAAASNTKATLEAMIDPEGANTTYHFEYVDKKGFDEDGFSGPTVQSTQERALAGSDFELYPANEEIGCAEPQVPPQPSCLTPETPYHFRVVTENGDGESEAQASFTTKPPLEILATWSSEVGTDGARLNAEVNPFGIPASAHFEYVDEETYEADLKEIGPGHGFDHASKAPPVGQIALGSGSTPITRGAQLFPLVPHTTYRYRLLATNPFATVPSASGTFTTFAPSASNVSCSNQVFRVGSSAALPDCRAYEQVSPLDKNGGDIVALVNGANDPTRLDQKLERGREVDLLRVSRFRRCPISPIYLTVHSDARGRGLVEPGDLAAAGPTDSGQP